VKIVTVVWPCQARRGGYDGIDQLCEATYTIGYAVKGTIRNVWIKGILSHQESVLTLALAMTTLLCSCGMSSWEDRQRSLIEGSHEIQYAVVRAPRGANLTFLSEKCPSITLTDEPLRKAVHRIQDAFSAAGENIPTLKVYSGPGNPRYGCSLTNVPLGRLLYYITQCTGTRAVFHPESNVIMIEPRSMHVD